jgi:hypothetical protein
MTEKKQRRYLFIVRAIFTTLIETRTHRNCAKIKRMTKEKVKERMIWILLIQTVER